MNRILEMAAKLHRNRANLGVFMEAVCALTVASAMIRFAPFRFIVKLASITLKKPVGSLADRRRIGSRVQWAVTASALRLPWRPLCFPQGLAAQWMLRRRGIDSTFYYGASTTDEQLAAHVWVCDGDHPIVGGRPPDRYRVLLALPNRSGE